MVLGKKGISVIIPTVWRLQLGKMLILRLSRLLCTKSKPPTAHW